MNILKGLLLSIVFHFLSSSVTSASEPTRHLSQDAFSAFTQHGDTLVIDVRTKREYEQGYIPGAINIPHQEIINGSITLEQYKDKNVVFYCHTGVRVGIVNQYLERKRALKREQIYYLKGDFRAWRARGKEILTP